MKLSYWLIFYYKNHLLLKPHHSPISVVFKLCAAALWSVVRNVRGAANFFRQYEIFKFFHRNLVDFSFKCCSMLFIIKNPRRSCQVFIFHKNTKKICTCIPIILNLVKYIYTWTILILVYNSLTQTKTYFLINYESKFFVIVYWEVFFSILFVCISELFCFRMGANRQNKNFFVAQWLECVVRFWRSMVRISKILQCRMNFFFNK